MTAGDQADQYLEQYLLLPNYNAAYLRVQVVENRCKLRRLFYVSLGHIFTGYKITPAGNPTAIRRGY